MSRLRRRGRDRAATRNALVRRKGGAVLDRLRQQVEGVLCVWLDQLELRKDILVGFDMVAVLHLVEPVCRAAMAVVIAFVTLFGQSGGNGACVGPRVQIDRQQSIHSSGYRDQRLADIACCRYRGDIGADVRGRQAVDIAVSSGARTVSVITRVEPLLPLA